MFNNGYPATYPYYTAPAPQQQTSRIWVQGEAGARSYLVAPGSTVELWDSEAPTIYLKSADAAGMPSIKTLDYTIREEAKQPEKMDPAYATKEDIRTVSEQITTLRERLDALTRRKRREEDDDE